MQEFISLAGIVGVLAVGVVSPGPSFVLIARVAMSTSRTNGLIAALGMGLGGVIYALAALLGLQAALFAVPALYVGLKVFGGLYLCYLGFRVFTGATQSFAAGASGPGHRAPISSSFWLGLTTQVSNPKAAIIYTSAFAAFLPASFSVHFALMLLCVVFTIEAGWNALVAAVLSSSRPRRIYLSCKTSVDRTAGMVLVGLGLKLVTSAHSA